MFIRSYAKINLALYVKNRRKDGFHNLETIFTSVNLSDKIHLVKHPELIVETDSKKVPSGPANLAYQAALAVKKAFHISDNVRIFIEKRIPMGGGLAGGSTNAAAVVRGLLSFWKISPDPKRITRILRALGSDVPYCYVGGTQLGRGRGERLTPLLPFPKMALTLVNPGIHVSTPLAYQSLKRNLTQRRNIINLYDSYNALLKRRLGLKEFLHNDFEDAVFKQHPIIRSIRDTFELFSPVGVLMSGSGSTVFALFESMSNADTAATYFKKKGFTSFITQTQGNTHSSSSPPTGGIHGNHGSQSHPAK
ncbi:MAG: 4-(cytidine 5'-diphospho)-2-C-methyl-D-erythritol kinase [Elusimicrobia bacterium RIFOXYB2_FULL_49_7]|nr:MAG: 4-(cytidine 5'-diphospho)-2-C-methyl-D-erythritol kinase [Elusimicrobia bacterium RIFOXYB2_FULL_49_7]